MTLKCSRCGSTDVRQEWSVFINPNDTDCFKDFDPTSLDYNDFEYCMDCEDETHLEEAE